jgi:hypothetical protein
MKKLLFTFAALSIAFASCLKNELHTTEETQEDNTPSPLFEILRINEVSGVEIPNGNTATIFYELFNTGTEPIDLEGFEIWYNAAGSAGQAFPPNDNRLTWKGGASAIQVAGTIEPGGFFLIQGRSNATPPGPIQTGLTSSRNLIITLRDADGFLVDRMARAEDNRAPWNVVGASNTSTMSRIPDGTGPFYFTPSPGTPGTTNGTSTTGLVAVPQTPQP